jgi:hypothetical protein
LDRVSSFHTPSATDASPYYFSRLFPSLHLRRSATMILFIGVIARGTAAKSTW